MKFALLHPRSLLKRKTARDDAMAGLVLGVESIPDGLASGLLAGVNPVAGLYGYMFGMVGGALFASTALMTVQATGAMSIIVADVDLAGRDDPAASLTTLAILTGAVMIAAGLMRLGSFLRFVSNSVMTGFVTAVGINIVLGQLDDFTGYESDGSNRVLRALDVLVHPLRFDLPTITVGTATIILIVSLQRTRLGPLGLVVAVFAGSAIGVIFRSFDHEIAQVRDIADVPRSLPFVSVPVLNEIPGLLLPALSLAFVGLVQGAAVSSGFPNRDGSVSDNSQDFVGQGAGNVVSGLFQGMPVGGSMSASAIVAGAGAKSRAALLYAGVVMAIVIVAFASVVERIAIPAVAGLLIVVGVGTVKPARIRRVARTGRVQLTVMVITFALTLVIPLQFAVLVGVGLSVLLFVVRESSGLTSQRLVFRDDGRVMETDPPHDLPPGEVVVLQPYGAIFFASAAILRDQMPAVTPETRHSVVILRVRGASEAGATLIDVLATYARTLHDAESKLVIVTANENIVQQLEQTGALATIGDDNVYRGTEFVGETVRRAHEDAVAWVAERTAETGAS